MSAKLTRRSVAKKMLGSTALLTSLPSLAMENTQNAEAVRPLKGNINHSVCRWCYDKIPFEDLCKAAKEMGIKSIDLVGPEEWPVLKKYGLVSAMPWGAGLGIEKGFNDPQYHETLIKSYEDMIPKVAAAGFSTIICFSGNRNGKTEEQGLENAALGLKKLMPIAEKHKVTMVMELLNSKVNHKDYQCDRTSWGVELCKRIGSENFKLLYDIYHMQIMEGDIIRTIKESSKYIAHYHTGGNPGRHEIDETQEIYYPAVMKAILETGYKGFVAQEFVPTPKEPQGQLTSLKKAVMLCDI
ncbi:TIM barrel protein [Cytophagaceae bacterium YF14B1]|uniref:TIM barrel protein n=1 Tax=Xanthocytophaga flava TaxID=3048013 RepID=A0AAE3U8J3_9BACT|nr:TIM barrel protein [Xanthocytophaga flavus]MDJ1481248.1 TIM barrel protein [Xanthocytophaga flavus]